MSLQTRLAIMRMSDADRRRQQARTNAQYRCVRAEQEAELRRIFGAEPPEPPAKSLWHSLKIAALLVTIPGAVGFASFIWEEALQTCGFSVKVAIDAHDYTTAASALSRLETMDRAAITWQRFAGWLCPWMHASYLAYFRDAVPSQIRSYGALIADHTADQRELDWDTVPIATNTVRVIDYLPTVHERQTNQVTVVESAEPTQAFWTKWRTNKWQMRKDGYNVTKRNGQWLVTRTNQIPKLKISE